MRLNEQNEPKTYNLFGLSVSNLDYDSILKLTEYAITKAKKITIGYINPHIARYANKNDELKNVLNSFSFNHIDGIGMELATNIFIKNEKFKRLNWTDEAFNYLAECEKHGWKIFFLGSDENTLTAAKDKILKRYPKLKLAGSLNGFEGLNNLTVKIINESRADILWVGIGSLRQETWIINNYENLICNVIQSVGDLYSELAGKRLRGPQVLRQLGLEWLFRMIQHPVKYFDRYIIGIPAFILIVVKTFFRNNR